MRKNTIGLAVVAGAAVIALAGCGLNGSTSDTSTTAGGPGSAATGASSPAGTGGAPVGDAAWSTNSLIAVNMRNIGRITGPQNPGSQIGMALCEPLTGIDEDGKVFMRGAESVSTTDQQNWTIKVAEGHTFSDGTAITAKTWVDSFNFVALGSNGMSGNYAFIDIDGYDALNPADGGKATATTLSGLKVVDDSTFTLKMKRPNNDVPFILSSLPYCPMPESAFKDPVAYDKAPIGNGPYVLTSLDPQVSAVLERDKNYHGWVPQGAASQITFKVYQDSNTAYQDVVAGNADIMRSLPPALVAQATKTLGSDGLTPIAKNTLQTYVTWPTYLDKTYPKEVRQAFSMLIDRDAIAKNLFLGAVLPARSLMPNSVSAWREDACGESCKFDPAAAQALIQQSGFTGTIPFQYSADDTSAAGVALAVSNEAKKIGLEIEPKPMAGTTLGDDTNNYKLQGPSIALWGSSFPSASEWIASITVDANYRLKYSNAEVDKLVAAAWAAGTQEEADKNWQAAEDLILADQVMQPLYYQIMFIAHAKGLIPGSAAGDMQIYRTDVRGK